jgi:UPF0755 protein
MLKMIKYLLLLIMIFSGLVLFYYWRGINEAADKNGGAREFIVEKGAGVKTISANLEKEGLIGSARIFEAYIWRAGKEKDLKAGTYELSPAMNIKEISGIIFAGNIVNRERDIVIIEGWRVEDIDDYLFKKGIAEKGEFAQKALAPVGDWTFSFDKPSFLAEAPAEATLEGYLFPDTYRLFEDASVEDIIYKMLDNFGRKMNVELLAEIKNKEMSLHDTIIMASILEKEVSGDDGPIVAGILYQRLEIGMRLEVDASINYITGKNNPSSELKDLAIDSPYNTYKYYGLPPGPISNPGLSSIRSAVFPEESPYLFYLNRQDTKETIFSKTHDEHVMNKNKYLR